MEDKLITILFFENPMDANLTKTLLDENGVNSYIADDIILTINPFYTTALGNVKLQINIKDKERALKILKENNYDLKIHNKYDNIKAEPCQKCNSRKVYPDKPKLIFIILSAFFLFIPLIVRKWFWRCYDCHFSWTEPITFNKVFISILIFPILLILWISIFLKIDPYFIHNDSRIINGYKDDIYKLELTKKLKTDKHLILINKVINIYKNNEDYEKAIIFLNEQIDSFSEYKHEDATFDNKFNQLVNSIVYEYNKYNCKMLNVIIKSNNLPIIIRSDKWKEYNKFIISLTNLCKN